MKATKLLFGVLLVTCLISCGKEKEEDVKIIEIVEDPATAEKPITTDAGTEPADKVPVKNDGVKSIREKVQAINSATLVKKTETYKCDELITIDYYYDGDAIVKVIVDYGTVGDHYQKTEYYYSEGKVVFIYDFTEGGPACEGCQVTIEKRNYIDDEREIYALRNKEDVTCTTCTYSSKHKAYRVIEAAKTKDFKSVFCS